ncbi:MAG: MBOAT family protein [Gammaproteobacteria bacterium]|nr:MBOAT family protein [Gammaproteobacteria bacterium]
MVFNTPIFFVFFVIFLLIYGLILVQKRPRLYFILVASLVFYGAWNYRFIPLLVGSSVIDYYLALAIAGAATLQRKKLLLTFSVAMNLGILALFKYADFVLSSVADFLLLFGIEVSLPTLAWVLPVGISFYTFQSLSYTIDVYRGDMEPRKGLVNFTTALAFFPQLVAGPILRARQILPQLHSLPVPTWDGARHGFLLFTSGIVKKTFADLLAGPAAVLFEADGPVSLLETWTGVLAFAGQIYGDFAGYTDMAIGAALIIGFKIPRNFNLPYFAISPIDFWRRWHISLSSWLRDYLYISLGGRDQRLRNVMITMLLGGLWHGAAWTFVAWGFFHAVIIMATHWLSNLKTFAGFIVSDSKLLKILKWAITFYLILIGWVLFRAHSIDSAIDIIGNMHTFGNLPEAGSVAIRVTAITMLAVIYMHLQDWFVIAKGEAFEQKRWVFWPVLVLLQAICLFVGAPSSEFIYFQF